MVLLTTRQEDSLYNLKDDMTTAYVALQLQGAMVALTFKTEAAEATAGFSSWLDKEFRRA